MKNNLDNHQVDFENDINILEVNLDENIDLENINFLEDSIENNIKDDKNNKEFNEIDNLNISSENENSDKKYKQLGFWIGLLCTFIVVTEIILNTFGVTFEVKIAVEVISYVLAFLVSVGILKGSKQSKNLTEIKDNIQDEILSNTKNQKTKKNDDQNKNVE